MCYKRVIHWIHTSKHWGICKAVRKLHVISSFPLNRFMLKFIQIAKLMPKLILKGTTQHMQRQDRTPYFLFKFFLVFFFFISSLFFQWRVWIWNLPIVINGIGCTRELVFISWYQRYFFHGFARPTSVLAYTMPGKYNVSGWSWQSRWSIFSRNRCATKPEVYCSHTPDHFLRQHAWALAEMIF